MIECIPIDGKVVHENFHCFLNHVREDRHHAPLEVCRSIAQPERHSTIGIGSIWACERGLALIIGEDGNLMIEEIPIKETKKGVLRQPFQHFINEGQWEVVLSCC